MSCRGPAFLVAPIGIGALWVALAATDVSAAQTAPGTLPGMRTTIDGQADVGGRSAPTSRNEELH